MIEQAVCPACTTPNRIGAGDARAAKCGRCGEKLFQGRPIDVNDADFNAHLRQTKGAPVVLDVWAPWCGPCRMMAPLFAETANRLEPRARFLKLNADENTAPQRLGVRGIPTLFMFENGKEIARHAGLMTAEQLTAWIAARGAAR